MKRFKKIKLGGYVDTITGEILRYEQVIQILKEEKRKTSSLIDCELEQIQIENGIFQKKDTHRFNWNNTRGNPTFFYKGYKMFQKEVSENMSLNEIGLLTVLTMNLETETNRVVIGGKLPSNKKLCDITGVSNKTLKNILASLRSKKLIATKGRGLGREIYVNPYWAFDGKDISKKTLDLFNTM